MNTRLKSRTFFAFLLSILLTACGGSGSPAVPLLPLPQLPPPSGALPEGDIVIFGAIPASGSFTVADVSFSTASASVSFNNQSAALSAIRPGHIIGIVGFTDASQRVTANQLSFEANIVGNIDSVDVAAQTLVVMGQTIDLYVLRLLGWYVVKSSVSLSHRWMSPRTSHLQSRQLQSRVCRMSTCKRSSSRR